MEIKTLLRSLLSLMFIIPGTSSKQGPWNGSHCPHGWIYNENPPKCMLLAFEKKMTYHHALASCRRKPDGNLVKFDDYGVFSVLAKHHDVLKSAGDPYYTVWIGLLHGLFNSNDRYIWQDGTVPGKDLEGMLEQDKPYPVTGNVIDCIVLVTGSFDRRNCSEEHYFVCEGRVDDPCLENNGGCDHKCLSNVGAKSMNCSCDFGFDLQNKTKCVDINPCHFGNGECSHKCQFIEPFVRKCSCERGFHLSGERSCAAEQHDGVFLMLIVVPVVVVAFIVCCCCILWRFLEKGKFDENQQDREEDLKKYKISSLDFDMETEESSEPSFVVETKRKSTKKTSQIQERMSHAVDEPPVISNSFSSRSSVESLKAVRPRPSVFY